MRNKVYLESRTFTFFAVMAVIMNFIIIDKGININSFDIVCIFRTMFGAGYEAKIFDLKLMLWLANMLAIHSVVGSSINEIIHKRFSITAPRYISAKNFYSYVIVNTVLVSVFLCVIEFAFIFIEVFIYGIINATNYISNIKQIMIMFFSFCIYVIFIEIIFTNIVLKYRKEYISLTIIVIAQILCIQGDHFVNGIGKYLFGNWGIYARTNIYSKYGYDIGVIGIVELVLSCAIIIIGKYRSRHILLN